MELDKVAERLASNYWESMIANRIAKNQVKVEKTRPGSKNKYRLVYPSGVVKYTNRKPKTESEAQKIPEDKKGQMPEKSHLGQGLYRIDSGTDFKKIMEDVVKGNKYAASVEVKDEYPDDWKLMTSKNRDATVAVKPDGDIVSVGKANGSNESRWGKRAIEIATKNGGDHLDCFETFLPHIYGAAGMRPVARVPFDDEFKPEGWDYDLYDEYNKGRPDIIFMVHDPSYKKYDPNDAELVGSYEEGQKMQKKYLDKRNSKEKLAEEKDKDKDYDQRVVDGLREQFGFSRKKALEILESF